MTVINGMLFASEERQLPEPSWYIEDLMNDRSIMMISAQPKEGKSALATHLMYSVATGEDFFGRTVKQGVVLYLAGERANLTEDRVLTLFKENGIKPQNYVIFVPTMSDLGPLKFNRDGDVERLIDFIKSFSLRPDLIIIDTLSQFFEGSQSSDETMHKFMEGVRHLIDSFKACGVVIHHDTKLYQDASGQRSGGGSYRGSGDALASVDAHIKGRSIKKVLDPDDSKGEKTINIVEFELGADNWGGFFKQTVAVRKLLENPTPYLEAQDAIRDDQKELALTVINDFPDMVESAWLKKLKEHEGFKGKMGTDSFSKIVKELVQDGLVKSKDNPKYKGTLVYYRV